jgi:DNA replication protein DnaC
MNQTTLSKMKTMKLYGMHGFFTTAIETGGMEDYTIDQFIAQLIEAEWDDKQNRKIARNIKNARFKYKASVEKISFHKERNLDENKLLRFVECSFINKGESILITGCTGVGKSYIATAIGYQGCIEGFRVMYFNIARLFAKLKMAKADGSYLKEIAKIERQHLIILDDFGLQPLDSQSRLALLEIIEDRNTKESSVIITSQLPVSRWYDMIGDKTIADAIMDRLVHGAHRIELGGESMRKKRTQKATEKLELITEKLN